MSKQVLVYQAYGIQDVMNQTMFSVATLLPQLTLEDALEIWIYTDNEKLFADFFSGQDRVKIIPITMDQVRKWRGAINFVHRVKVEILSDAAQKFSGTLLYCDGDTYFRQSPMQLFNRVDDTHSLMHIAESTLKDGSDPLSKKINKFVRKNRFQVAGQAIQIPSETMMWNAGALGISQANKRLLPLVLELTDKTYALYSKHTMEQLAFSYYLQSKSEVFPADQVIYHYWNQKDEYQQKINQFLSAHPSAKKMIEALRTFEFPASPVPKMKRRVSNLFGLLK